MADDSEAWYYWWNPEEKKWCVLAFVNRGKSCSMRQWHAAGGKAAGRPFYPKPQTSHFQEEKTFTKYLNGTSSLRLYRNWGGNVADWGKELPDEALCEIRKQVKEWLDTLWASIS